MNGLLTKSRIALAVMSAMLAAPAAALQLTFEGGSNLDDLVTVTGDDGIGGSWQTHNNVGSLESNFAMRDVDANPQPFNEANFNNGLGPFINSFQLTMNSSQSPEGFKGINTGPSTAGLENFFTVMPDLGDPSTWVTWDVRYTLVDPDSGLFQRVLFTSPPGTQLDPGVNFSTNVNFEGIFTADAGWAASYDDRAHVGVAEPASMALAMLGLAGFAAVRRRHS